MLLLLLAVCGGNYARTALGPLQEAVRVSLSLSDNAIALLQGFAQALPVVLAAVPLGIIIDRYSRARLLLWLAALTVTGGLLTALAGNFALLFTARSLIGLTASATATTALSLLADLYVPEQRGRATMAFIISQMVGNSAAFATGGALLVALGPTPDSWRWAIVWMTAPLAVVVAGLFALREPLRTGQVLDNPSLRTIGPELWRYRSRIAPLLAGMLLVELSFGAIYIWGVSVLTRSFALPADRVGSIMAIGLLTSGLAGPLLGGPLADFCQRTGGPRRTLLAASGLALLTVPAALFPFVASVWYASALFVVFLVLICAAIVVATALFTIVVPSEVRGLCMAITLAAAGVFALGIAPVTVSLLAGAFGGPTKLGAALSVTAAISGLLAAAAYGLASRNIEETTRA